VTFTEVGSNERSSTVPGVLYQPAPEISLGAQPDSDVSICVVARERVDEPIEGTVASSAVPNLDIVCPRKREERMIVSLFVA